MTEPQKTGFRLGDGPIDIPREVLDLTKRDAYLFLGNTKQHPQNFMVVGLFYPPKIEQASLFA